MASISNDMGIGVTKGKSAPSARRKRKPRPSTARGLRTSTGCLTCRKRRVKCDEARPRCANCTKSDRVCDYAVPSTVEKSGPLEGTSPDSINLTTDGNEDTAVPELLVAAEPVPVTEGRASVVENPVWPGAALSLSDLHDHPLQHDSPATVRSSLLDYDPAILGSADLFDAPYNWYDLLAADAIDDLQRHKDDADVFWDFNATSLSRRRSPAPEEPVPETVAANNALLKPHDDPQASYAEPWNSPARFHLETEELVLFKHYIDVVGPILDLQDPEQHFTIQVPHLALRNEGLLKAVLAVAARQMAMQMEFSWRTRSTLSMAATPASSDTFDDPKSSQTMQTATRYYYETLRYLSQTLLYPSYTQSLELLATAILISSYEMFEAYGTSNNRNWEKHLQGSFFIQNHLHKENNAESTSGMRRAVWWAWMRQDVCAAFQTGRPAMTIFRPRKRLNDLNSDELAVRIIWISAKCVQFAATRDGENISSRAEKGRNLLRMLDEWRQRLPAAFNPILCDYEPGPAQGAVESAMGVFRPIWIHPPSYAAAIMTYHFSRIVVLLHDSVVGHAAHRTKEKMLAESMEMICGIALAEQSQNLPCAFVSLQALYAAGLCIRTNEQELAIQDILAHTLAAGQIPTKNLVQDWSKVWSEG